MQNYIFSTGIGFFATLYVILALTIGRWMPDKNNYNIGPRQIILSILMLLIFEIFFALIFRKSLEYFQSSESLVLIAAQINCIVVLYLQNVLFDKSAIQKELDTINYIRNQQKAQYSMSKENIALINRKCHDMKHQILALQTMNNEQEQSAYIKEVEKAIDIYDAIIKTGNDALDVILTEKSLYCEANSIIINYVVDGQQLSFIEHIDLYTIFGNSLDNAITSVEKFNEKEKRFIDVIAHRQNQSLVVQIINPVVTRPDFVDGLPVSTKPNNGYHGFGIKKHKTYA